MQLAATGRMSNIGHFHGLFEGELLRVHLNRCTHMFDLRRYIIGYMFGNHTLLLHGPVAIKLNFWPYIRQLTPQMKILNTVIS